MTLISPDMPKDIIEIKGLHRICSSAWEDAVQMMLRAFRDYPKLSGVFPAFADRQAGIEATLRYYGAFDLHYGAAFSLDRQIRECVMLMHSDEMNYSEERIRAAACENPAWRSAIQRLDGAQQRLWFELFDELDRLEADLSLPEQYLYLDFLAVDPDHQGCGRGRRLLQAVSAYADAAGLPMMLFTNTPEDVRFYERNGFHIAGVTESNRYGFKNTYMIKPAAAAIPR